MPNITTAQLSSMGMTASDLGRKGKTLERRIIASQTTVRLTQIPQSARHIGAGKIVAVRGPVDFVGIHVPTGRMIIFDAKETHTETRLETNKDKIAPHQRAEIIRYGESGAIAGLLACCTTTGCLYWCHWGLLIVPAPSIEWGRMLAIGTTRFAVKWDLISRFEHNILRGQTTEQAMEGAPA